MFGTFKLSLSKAKSQIVRSRFGFLLYIKFKLIYFIKTKFKFIFKFIIGTTELTLALRVSLFL